MPDNEQERYEIGAEVEFYTGGMWITAAVVSRRTVRGRARRYTFYRLIGNPATYHPGADLGEWPDSRVRLKEQAAA